MSGIGGKGRESVTEVIEQTIIAAIIPREYMAYSLSVQMVRYIAPYFTYASHKLRVKHATQPTILHSGANQRKWRVRPALHIFGLEVEDSVAFEWGLEFLFATG